MDYNKRNISSSLPFISTFTRNIPINYENILNNLNNTINAEYFNDSLNCLFNRVQLQLDKLIASNVIFLNIFLFHRVFYFIK